MFAVSQRRALATSARAFEKYIVIARDFPDPDALLRRMAVRDKHLENIKPALESKKLIAGGPMFDSHDNGKMTGSCMIVEAASREEVEKMITDDIYVKGKVWESWDIYPWKVVMGKIGQ
ncbi:hypothetical protein VTP01DRAFT_6240 [Rhizomucor pusillus]|uniref:uncharacterized protein n=1 Tax=Rhizomucor pusillus TaxID=4840 RepID=UPI003743DEC4